MEEDLKNELDNARSEIEQLREIIGYNAKVLQFSKRGRPHKFDEPLTERMVFIITKTQRTKLKEILKKDNTDLSSYIRYLIFGEKL